MSVLGVVLENGGLILWPIAALSIAALTVVIERLWRLLPLRRRFVEVRAACNDALLHGGTAQALNRLDEADPLSRVLRAGLAVAARGPEAVRAMALDAAQREVPALERGLGIILATTQVAPLFGLLGTVIGLIQAFQDATAADALSAKIVAGGVYKALGATVAGLAVAIPAFLAYAALSSFIGRLIDQLEHSATDLPVLLPRNP